MKRALGLVALALVLTTALFGQTAWMADTVHSRVGFAVKHLIISEVEGNFKLFSGALQTSRPDLTDAVVEFTVDVNSINTENETRDKHLKSDDFFNVEKFPKATFKSAVWRRVADQNYVVEGDLTIRDVTRRVAFDVVYNGTVKDPWGNTRAGFKATTVINRFDYGLKWNALTEAGGAVVGKDVTITLNLEFAQKKSS